MSHQNVNGVKRILTLVLALNRIGLETLLLIPVLSKNNNTIFIFQTGSIIIPSTIIFDTHNYLHIVQPINMVHRT